MDFGELFAKNLCIVVHCIISQRVSILSKGQFNNAIWKRVLNEKETLPCVPLNFWYIRARSCMKEQLMN